MRQGLEAWKRDFAIAARSLVRAPGFTAVVLTTLALAIGANTAIFSVVDAVLLDPLSFPDPDRLVSIHSSAPGSDLPEEFGPGGEFFIEYGENATGLADLGYFSGGQTSVRSGDRVERIFISSASPSLFTTLGVTPVLGRLPQEDDPEGVVGVLSHWLWSDWFGQDPGVIDQSIEVSGQLITVIGVMGPDFRFPSELTSLWIHDLITEPVNPGNFGLNFIGRMAPGTDHETLTAELTGLARRLPERFGGPPAYARIIEQHRPIVRSLEEELVGDIAGPLWILVGTVGIVLLIACANVANLLLVRAETRQRDLAVRRALGSGRAGLIRTQMAEALLLATAGGAAGVALAWIGVPMLVRAAPENIPRLSTVGLDPKALLFTAGLATVAALASGLLPAIRFSNPQIMKSLRDSRRVGTGPDHLTRNALVVVQTAAALVLMVGSGLLFQSFRELRSVDPGFDTEDIFTFQTAPDTRAHGLVDGPTFARFHYEFMERLAAIPGVQSVGLVNTLPLDEGAGSGRVQTERSTVAGELDPLVGLTFVGGEYFQTMGIRLLSGSYLEPNAEPTADVRAIVSRTAGEQLWPGEDPIGKRFKPSGTDSTFAWITVAGVVNDVMLADFRQETPQPLLYLPMVGFNARAWSVGTPAYVVKSTRAESMAPEVQNLIREVSPSAPMYRVFTMAGLAARSMAQLSFTMLTIAVAAVLALILGAVGIYGVLSYVVSQRTREIGIRMALGAQAGTVRRMVMMQGARVALIGVVIGVVAAVFLARVLDSLLFGVGAVDPITFVVMSSSMIGVALLASYLPAWRASSVSPMRSLQAE